MIDGDLVISTRKIMHNSNQVFTEYIARKNKILGNVYADNFYSKDIPLDYLMLQSDIRYEYYINNIVDIYNKVMLIESGEYDFISRNINIKNQLIEQLHNKIYEIKVELFEYYKRDKEFANALNVIDEINSVDISNQISILRNKFKSINLEYNVNYNKYKSIYDSLWRGSVRNAQHHASLISLFRHKIIASRILNNKKTVDYVDVDYNDVVNIDKINIEDNYTYLNNVNNENISIEINELRDIINEFVNFYTYYDEKINNYAIYDDSNNSEFDGELDGKQIKFSDSHKNIFEFEKMKIYTLLHNKSNVEKQIYEKQIFEKLTPNEVEIYQKIHKIIHLGDEICGQYFDTTVENIYREITENGRLAKVDNNKSLSVNNDLPKGEIFFSNNQNIDGQVTREVSNLKYTSSMEMVSKLLGDELLKIAIQSAVLQNLVLKQETDIYERFYKTVLNKIQRTLLNSNLFEEIIHSDKFNKHLLKEFEYEKTQSSRTIIKEIFSWLNDNLKAMLSENKPENKEVNFGVNFKDIDYILKKYSNFASGISNSFLSVISDKKLAISEGRLKTLSDYNLGKSFKDKSKIFIDDFYKNVKNTFKFENSYLYYTFSNDIRLSDKNEIISDLDKSVSNNLAYGIKFNFYDNIARYIENLLMIKDVVADEFSVNSHIVELLDLEYVKTTKAINDNEIDANQISQFIKKIKNSEFEDLFEISTLDYIYDENKQSKYVKTKNKLQKNIKDNIQDVAKEITKESIVQHLEQSSNQNINRNSKQGVEQDDKNFVYDRNNVINENLQENIVKIIREHQQISVLDILQNKINMSMQNSVIKYEDIDVSDMILSKNINDKISIKTNKKINRMFEKTQIFHQQTQSQEESKYDVFNLGFENDLKYKIKNNQNESVELFDNIDVSNRVNTYTDIEHKTNRSIENEYLANVNNITNSQDIPMISEKDVQKHIQEIVFAENGINKIYKKIYSRIEREFINEKRRRGI